MLSPSLISMLLHGVWSDVGRDRAEEQLIDGRHVVNDLAGILASFGETGRPIPSVPVVGRTKHINKFDQRLIDQVQVLESGRAGGGVFLFGRVPVDVLFQRLTDSHVLDFDEEYLDLGTPITASQSHPGSVANLTRLLTKRKELRPRLQVALIDIGVEAPNKSPSDFSNRLTHIYTKDLDFSPHASQVLGALLERLDLRGILSSVDLICGLIVPPNVVSRQCFQSANAVELELALHDLDQLADRRPLFVNASLGTHVGPHNGMSPLEKATVGILPYSDQRLLVFAAGNDGGSGVSARRELLPNRSDYLRFKTSHSGTKDLLLEFWWEESQTSSLELTVSIRLPNGQPACLSIRVTPQSMGVNSAASFQAGGTIQCMSVYHARCSATMCCIAFAMSSPKESELADLTIDIEMTCQSKVVVNAWRVLPSHDSSSFVVGANECSITVPATAPEIVSVAGMERDGRSWIESSRGPTADYVFGGSSWPTAPMLSHLVQYIGVEKGTSYASPRAMADLAANADKGGFPSSAFELVKRELGPAFSAWDPRIGYGGITN